jgi:Family of unknown function (DUF6627)
MYTLIQKRKTIAIPIIIALSIFSIISTPARAAMIGTGEIVKQNQHDLLRQRINMFLDRSEVQQYFVNWGISSQEAKARVNSLTDEEIENIASRIDQLPPGGSAVGTIVGAALIVFIILLVTDILGLTDVFPFIRK